MTTIILQAGDVLRVAADAFGSGYLTQTPESFGATSIYSPLQVYPSTALSVGPFNTTTLWDIATIAGTLTESIIQDRRPDNQYGTGIYSGGLITINTDTTKFNVAAGVGTIVDNYTDPDNPDIIKVEWDDRTAIDVTYLATNFTSYIAIDRQANIVQFDSQLTSDQHRDYIELGILVHTDLATIQGVGNTQIPAYDYSQMLVDLCDSIGVVNKSGNQISANGANLKINKSSGESFFPGLNWPNSQKNTNITTDVALVAPIMFRSYRDGAGSWAQPILSDVVDVAYYDNGTGTLALLTANDPWQIFRIFFAPSNSNIIIAYGQNVYKTMADAEAVIESETFIQNPVLNDQSFRGYLIVKRDATSLADTTKAKFITAGIMGAGTAIGSSTATTDLQGAYDNSLDPEIITDSTHNAVTIQDGTNSATAKLLSLKNYATTEVGYINASGQYSGGITGGTTANRPVSPTLYYMYYDTTLGIPIWYNGTNWKNSAGTTV